MTRPRDELAISEAGSRRRPGYWTEDVGFWRNRFSEGGEVSVFGGDIRNWSVRREVGWRVRYVIRAFERFVYFVEGS